MPVKFDFQTKEYWNERTLANRNDLQAMIFQDAGFHQLEEDAKFILNFILDREGLKVLDIACGPGRFYETVAKKGCDYVGLDFSEEMIRLANELHPNGNFVCSDAWEYNNKKLFDVVFEINSMKCLTAGKLAETIELLELYVKDGGTYVIIEKDLILIKHK